MDRSVRVMEAITNLPKPVIAAVHGYASAAGLQLVDACDLVASEDSRFDILGIRLGLFCITPMVSLPKSVGRECLSCFSLLTAPMLYWVC